MKIGWIGLGLMGNPMATNLINAGYSLYVYNRTSSKAESLVQKGAVLCQSPKEVAQHSDIVITMLSNVSAVEEVFAGEEGILKGISNDSIVIDMSTVSPKDSVHFAQLVNRQQAHFIDAPVSGSVQPAKEGTLLILAGGDASDIETCKPIFDVLGKQTIHFGENGKGSAAKLSINLLLGITIQGASETFVLAEKLGLQKADVAEMISNAAVNTPIFQMKKSSFLNEDFPAAFMLELMSKDLGLVKSEMESAQIDLPLATAANKTYASAKESGKGKSDVAAVYLEIKERNF
ncbi:NAD(P)-dependent oxidoreductase [Heyndrickxia ginsengihumi]|uniref:NAD(P)-dependent oxidoreductase n=1 Tax=Heyndrickxia ginsengihumi TaxID=363870 RepID=UPI001DE22C90|nr:NAD(P)-dependent oxidoreductase [Heyndrickxia ginsengihumi]MBE6185485.1 NAD(P)-dependent oxidoreductase [Bacillus sp. (in: firmicutes)]MCM3023421.1 NAD(P)-dependent oxidoreductase [Heyndrickxia ginsengihumi]